MQTKPPQLACLDGDDAQQLSPPEWVEGGVWKLSLASISEGGESRVHRVVF